MRNPLSEECNLTHLLIQLWPLASDCGKVRCDAGLHNQAVHLLDLFAVLGHIIEQRREVETESAIELHINHAGRNDATAEINGLVRQNELIVEGRLAVDDLARHRADPEVFFDEGVAPQEAAVGELGQAILWPSRGYGDGHDWLRMLGLAEIQGVIGTARFKEGVGRIRSWMSKDGMSFQRSSECAP